MKRLLVAVGLLLTASLGNASLETDCYFAGGYFESTYMQADLFDETCGATGDPPAAVSGADKHKDTLRFPGLWR